MNETLKRTGIEFWQEADFSSEEIILRDGRTARLWVEKETGHGILDCEFWEKDDYYEEDYRKEFTAVIGEWVENENNLKLYANVNQRQFETFKKYITPETHYLEIGASFGGVFNLVSSVVKDAWCVEPNRKDAEFIRSKHPSAQVFNAYFSEKLDLPSSYFDIVTNFEVLEHVPTPVDFLKNCAAVLKSGGKIHLEVPNRKDLLYYAYDLPRYQTFYHHKAHIHYYTAESLKKMMNETGFCGEVQSFLMYPFFNHVFWCQNNTPQKSGADALNLSVPLKNVPEAKELHKFWKKCETEYFSLVNQLGIGDCLIFSGYKK